jgi:hypothetical protein
LNMNCDIAFTYMNEIRPLNGMVKWKESTAQLNIYSI